MVRPTLLILVFSVLAAAPAFATPSVAILPLEGVEDAAEKHLDFLEPVLHKAFRKARLRLIRGSAVRKVMPEGGSASCDTACLVAIGEKLGVDRVIAPTLRIQLKFTAQGVAWTLKLRQVHVKKQVEWGTFSKLCLCAKKTWDAVCGRLVERAIDYDPATVLTLPETAVNASIQPPESDHPDMVVVPAGPFIMGTEHGEWNDEAPRHLVHLNAYLVDRTEVTNAAYQRCVDAGKCRRGRYANHRILGKATHPVAGPNWHDAVSYCAFAGKRLPTEAEWEKAARGTDERVFPWGNTWDPMKLNRKGADDGFELSAPVGSFPAGASPYGALHMAGSQWEWTADVYSSIGYRSHAKVDPQGPTRGRKKAMRGGSWMYDRAFFHSAHNRSPGRPEVRKKYVGFRCAKSLPAR